MFVLLLLMLGAAQGVQQTSSILASALGKDSTRFTSGLGRRLPRFLHRKYADKRPVNVRQDLLNKCNEEWRDATLDHFNWGPGDLGVTSFKQRYFLCDTYWGVDDDGFLGPIFFYLGNEADVTLYLNNTGLMWESAPEFRALIIFAEHRYYGKSVPYQDTPGASVRDHMRYLSAEQALMDYAELIEEIKYRYNATSSPVIGFGGSYGGMLAAWMRMKYPHLLDGAVAGSAPIWNFMGEKPAFDPISFSKGVTWDASVGGGSVPGCVENVRHSWRILDQLARTIKGRATIASSIGLCSDVTLDNEYDIYELRDWLASAWDYMAMGNFPYESGYILNGHGILPAYPVRVACKLMVPYSPYHDDNHATTHTEGRKMREEMGDEDILKALGQAAGVYYNYTGDLKCFDFREGANPDSDATADFWGYQYCTEMFMPFAKDGEQDMFWWEPWKPNAVAQSCNDTWGVWPRRYQATTQWGGRKIGASSRIVFSNGLLDPWHGGGVLRDVNDDLIAMVIPEGAHHLDLMFSHPKDPQSVKEVRLQQRRLMHHWVELARRDKERHRSWAENKRDENTYQHQHLTITQEEKEKFANRKVMA